MRSQEMNIITVHCCRHRANVSSTESLLMMIRLDSNRTVVSDVHVHLVEQVSTKTKKSLVKYFA